MNDLPLDLQAALAAHIGTFEAQQCALSDGTRYLLIKARWWYSFRDVTELDWALRAGTLDSLEYRLPF